MSRIDENGWIGCTFSKNPFRRIHVMLEVRRDLETEGYCDYLHLKCVDRPEYIERG